VIGYIAEDRFKLDLRTIFPQQDELIIKVIGTASSRHSERSQAESKNPGETIFK
jgi:hypothetical protein